MRNLRLICLSKESDDWDPKVGYCARSVIQGWTEHLYFTSFAFLLLANTDCGLCWILGWLLYECPNFVLQLPAKLEIGYRRERGCSSQNFADLNVIWYCYAEFATWNIKCFRRTCLHRDSYLLLLSVETKWMHILNSYFTCPFILILPQRCAWRPFRDSEYSFF
jgi:hypothetical protein